MRLFISKQDTIIIYLKKIGDGWLVDCHTGFCGDVEPVALVPVM